MPCSIPLNLVCDLPSLGSVDAGCAFMCDVRLRDEGSQFGEVNGRGANAEHAMTEGTKSTEKMERGIGEPVSTGEEEDA